MIDPDELQERVRFGEAGSRREGELELHAFAKLRQLQLNGQQSIDLKFLTRGRTTCEVRGQIDGGRIEPYQPTDPRRIRRVVALLAVALIVALLAFPLSLLGSLIAQGSCVPSSSPLKVDGSSAFSPTARAFAADYRATCPLPFTFNEVEVSGHTSHQGLTWLRDGSIQVAASELPAPQGWGLVEHKVAGIVFAMIVNRSVTNVNSLTRAQITHIYSGAITNWREVGGPICRSRSWAGRRIRAPTPPSPGSSFSGPRRRSRWS
jgi:PBP superfamily domain